MRWYSVLGSADSMRLFLRLFNIEETIFPTEFNCVAGITVYQTAVGEKKTKFSC